MNWPELHVDVVVTFFEMSGFATPEMGTSAWQSCVAHSRRVGGFPGQSARRSALVRGVLAQTAGAHVEEIAFDYSARGKPTLRGPLGQLHFSCSYAGPMVAIATSFTCPIGLDVERVIPKNGLRRVASTRFTKGELDVSASAPDRLTSLTQFYRSWVMREAFVKLIGSGLAGLSGAPGHPQLDSSAAECRAFAVHTPVLAWYLEGPTPLNGRFALASHSEISSYSLHFTTEDDVVSRFRPAQVLHA